MKQSKEKQDNQNNKSKTNKNFSSEYKVKKSKIENNKKQNKYGNSRNQVENLEEATNPWYMVPIILVMSLIPLIVRMKIYDPRIKQFKGLPSTDFQYDFFLYYKQWFFVAIAVIMLIILLCRIYIYKKPVAMKPVFIPLMIYALFAVLSTIFSDYASYSLKGSLEQFESLFALLGYCIVAFYAYYFINSAKDVKLIFKIFTISVLILGLLGLGQYLGHDFFFTTFGKKLILPTSEWANIDAFEGNFNGQVYLTLYNPNYVGVYTSLVAPVILVLLLFSKNIVNSILYLLALVGLIISVIGSYSMAGFFVTIIAFIGVFIFLWRYLLKRFYIFIPVLIVIIGSLFLVNKYNDNLIIRRIKGILEFEKSEYKLTSISTLDDRISIIYDGNVLNMEFQYENNTIGFKVTDEEGNLVPTEYNEADGFFAIKDERYPGFTYAPVMYSQYLSFYVKIEGEDWLFSNQVGDGTYYYMNVFGKPDKIVPAETAIFTDYEWLASGRGYIWSRTIPLLKDNIILGSGPDTFVFEFPHQDYVSYRRNNPSNNVLTKPHSLYLQIGVQTGVISLIAFILFYGIYFISSVLLYIRGRFNNYYAQVGLGILMGTFGYMVCGLTNDSTITVAPVFWGLMGIGIAVNAKAKPLIMEEEREAKERKLEMKKKQSEIETIAE